MMLPTPSTSHVDLDRVYEPAEDSFLLLDTLSSASEVEFLKQRFISKKDGRNSPSPSILEVGTGSGLVLAFITAHARAIFGRADVLSLGVDINGVACEATEQTVFRACEEVANGHGDLAKPSGSAVLLASLKADLTTSLRSGMVDMLIFNPPYVPTSELPALPILRTGDERQYDEIGGNRLDTDSDLLSLSYAGGVDGMEVTDKLLNQLPILLSSERGMAYILLCKQNKPEEVVKRIREWGPNWSVDVVGHSGRTGGWEKLQIIRICRM